ncbi:DUF1542 domain-containing protein, partial [Streptococcus suis]|nr:DUF1542 domain-containing protein [Streptococcus suis]
MSSKDMFRKEQRFSFRKFSFGLASAVIANVIFGGAIASSPVVHANTTTETAAVATSERIASIPYTVNIVDQTGKVVETKEKKVLVYTVETIATATEYLTADLVPEGYAIVSGLGEVTLTENAENVFTVKVDKIAPEAVATTTTAESATSETSTAAATPEPASLTATQPTPVTSEVAEAEVAPTTSEESAKPTERTVYLSYITHYVNEANETVDRTGHLVAVTTTDDTAKTQVTVSASENMPSGWKLVQDKAKVVVQLVENQTNILVFAVTKKSKEEEIAASQLSNKDVLEQVLSEGVLLSNDAARLLETSQAGNTGLEVATNNTKAVLKEAIQVFDEPTSTQEQVDAQTELVRAASKTLADELLKFDEDGVLTAMLDATANGITITTSSKGKVRPKYADHIRDFATNNSQQSYNDQDFFFGLIGKALTQADSQIRATAEAADGSTLPVSLVGGGGQPLADDKKFGLEINNSGVIYGTTTIQDAGDTVSWQFQAQNGSDSAGSQFTFVPYTVVKTDTEPVRKAVTAGVTADEILAKVKSDVTRDDGSTRGPLNATFEEYFNTTLTARATGKSTTVTQDAKAGKQIWHEIKQYVKVAEANGTAVSGGKAVTGSLPTEAGTYNVTVLSTNVHGQTIDTAVVVDLYEIVKIPSSASEKAPKGYVTVTFKGHKYTRGFTLGTQTDSSVKVFVKENVKWGELLDDPAWQWPTVKTDEGDTVVGWSVNDYNYKPGNAFARDNYKDTDVTNITLYPNVVFEVEDVGGNGTKEGYLAQYGPDEQDKWIFITFDADQGQLSGSKQSKMVAVSKNLYSIDFSNKKFKEKVESPTLQGHTFVRWQTDAGEVLPKSGEITTDTTYKALYLAHPTDKTVVFDANKLTDTEKDSLKQAINNANTDSANLIQSITVSDTGEATVTYNDGTVVTVPASHLINEDKAPARNLAKEEIDDKLAEEKAAIEAKRDAAIAEINNTPGLTDDQKQAATDAVTNTANDALTALDTAADDAKKAIDTKTTAADFNDAKTAGEKALDDAKAAGEAAINLTKDKELAKADVENQAAAAIEAIKNNPNLNEDEQAPYIDAIEKAAEEQKAAIDAAKDTVGITEAVDAAEKVNEEQKLAAAKQDAKNKIAKDVEAANAAIESNPNLTKDEIDAAKAAVADEAKKANDAIDAATTPEAVQAKEEEGTKAIAADVLDAAKLDAKNKIAKDVEAAEDAINSNPNLSKEEKQTFKDAVDDAAKTANDAIDKATTPETVQTAEDNGVKAIDAKELAAAKQDAKNKIAEDVKAAKEAIDNNPNLSKEEKQTFKDAVDDAAKTANGEIDKATTPETVQTAEDNGVKAIDAKELAAAKQDAKNKIAEEAAAAKDAIDKNPNLSEDEKRTFKDAVDKAAQTANDAIDKATTPAEVQTAEDNGVKAIDAKELDAAKQDAKNKIAKDVEAAKDAIDKNPNLSEDEKQGFKDAVDVAAQTANGEIDKATTPETVQTAEDNGVKAIDAKELDAAKQDAKNKIAKDVEAANAAIESNPNLSEKEIADAKAEVAKAAEDANKAIAAATTPETAQAAEETGTKEIAADVLDAAKQDAKNKIAKDLATVEAAIDANSNLSEDEKKAAKLAAQAKAADAVTNIEKATTPAAVQTLEDAAVKELANIEIKAAYDDAVKAIEAADNLSTAAKSQALDDLKKARQAAEKAITDATTADEVATAALAGVKSLAKVEAKAAADDAKAAIAQNSNLTDDEKKVYTDAIDKALKATETKIDDATDADTVDAETVLAQKDIAKQEVAAATADAVKGIEANTNLTPEEKAEYKANVAKAAADAEKAITEATTAADIQSKTFDATQAAAKEEVKADAADAVKGIQANDNLSEAEKTAAKEAVEKARDTTLENIEKAKTAADIETATLDAEKANAKAELKAAADDAKKAIDENTNLPKSEKDALKLAIDAEVAAANLEIDNAKTAEDIDVATLATEKTIAKTEVKAAAEDALRSIDENANLTDDEKAKAKADVYVELSKAEKAIDKAATAEAIDNATLVGEKAIAKEELEAAADDAKKAIDANTHLTDAEKKAAKDAVDTELAKAKDAIDAAKTADAVDAATLVGEKAVAKEEVKAAADDAKKAIDANSNLTDDEKAAAKKAVDAEVAKANEAIDAATKANEVDTATLAGEKAVAKEEVKAAADDAKKAIDANDNLTPDEKAAAKAAVDAEVAKANEAIDAAKTADAVDAATLVGEKAVAKEELKAAAADAKKAIDANDNLTPDEKAAAKKAVDAEVAKANEAIDAAKTADAVDAATLAGEKAVAKEEVKAAAEDALRAIDENANLTDDEKAKAKADVYVELSKAEKAIDKATTADAIDNATLVGEKAFAKEELEAAADDAKAAIDANDNLTDAEKAAAKKAVDDEAAKAEEAIDAATKADEVDAATLAGEKAVAKEELKAAAEDAKKAIDAAKQGAKNKLMEEADKAKAAIDANPNLTPEEKAAAKKAVDAEVAKAEKAIDAATKADEVDTATLAGEKAVAKEELKAAAEDAKKAIDANPNLSDAEKQAAKDAVDASAAAANKAIDGSTSSVEVQAAKDKG